MGYLPTTTGYGVALPAAFVSPVGVALPVRMMKEEPLTTPVMAVPGHLTLSADRAARRSVFPIRMGSTDEPNASKEP